MFDGKFELEEEDRRSDWCIFVFRSVYKEIPFLIKGIEKLRNF